MLFISIAVNATLLLCDVIKKTASRSYFPFHMVLTPNFHKSIIATHVLLLMLIGIAFCTWKRPNLILYKEIHTRQYSESISENKNKIMRLYIFIVH